MAKGHIDVDIYIPNKEKAEKLLAKGLSRIIIGRIEKLSIDEKSKVIEEIKSKKKKLKL